MKKIQVVYTKTCIFCAPTKQIWRDLQKKHKFDYEEIDAESLKGQQVVRKFNIMSVPTTIVDGKIQFVGMPNKAKAEEAVTG